MRILCPYFGDNQLIPLKYSAYADNLSPELNIKDIPLTTKSLAISVEDPDAPGTKPWQHWLIWNIPSDTNKIKEGAVDLVGVEGLNDSHEIGYFGPMPPSGTHRYYFRLFALDAVLDLPKGSTRSELDEKMRNHIITRTHLIGLFKK